MTRDEAHRLERQLRALHPADNVEVIRVPGGVEVTCGSTFVRAADDSPLLLLLLGARPEMHDF